MDDTQAKFAIYQQQMNNPERTRVASAFRPSTSVVYRQPAPGQRAPTVVTSATRTSGSHTYQVISPQRRIAMSATTGRPVAVTPISVRTVGGGGSSRLLSGSAPGNLGIKRPLEFDFSMNMKKYHRTADKSKGLRHFSTKVCEKVKQKGRTNYNEVADELVQEYFESLVAPGELAKIHDKQTYDMKNIRRRVYDALNVLMAMNIIEKEKKEIRWVGLPTSSIQECKRLEEEKHKRVTRIREKAEQLQELVVQLVAYKSLVERNREAERTEGRPPQNTLLYLPYIVINTDKKTMIDCSISHDKTEYLFNFDQPFEIHDDIEVLKRLGLSHGLEKGEVASEEDRDKIKVYLPETMRPYVDKILDKTLGGSAAPPPEPQAPPPQPGPRGFRRSALPDPRNSQEERRIPLVTSRLVKQPQYVSLPSNNYSNPTAPDYGTTAYHSRFARRQPIAATATAVSRDLPDRGGVRYHVVTSRASPNSPAPTQDYHHSYSSANETRGPPLGAQGVRVVRRPATYVISGQQGGRAAGGSPVGASGGYGGGYGGNGSGESDYSDMDSLGSNSNQGY